MDTDLAAFSGLPLSQTHRLLGFDHAAVESLESFPPQLVLRVRGTAPYPAMRITLEPRIYVRQPDYWGIEVVGMLIEPEPARPTPYEVALDLSGPMGTEGIEVIGAGVTKRILLAKDDPAGGQTQVVLRGIVKDSGGWPLPGVLVRADAPGQESAGISGTTDGDGRYSMRLAGPGRYRITTEMPGYTHALGEIEVRAGWAARQDFYLAPLEDEMPQPVPEKPGGGAQEPVPVPELEGGGDVVEGSAESNPPKVGSGAKGGRRRPRNGAK